MSEIQKTLRFYNIWQSLLTKLKNRINTARIGIRDNTLSTFLFILFEEKLRPMGGLPDGEPLDKVSLYF